MNPKRLPLTKAVRDGITSALTDAESMVHADSHEGNTASTQGSIDRVQQWLDGSPAETADDAVVSACRKFVDYYSGRRALLGNGQAQRSLIEMTDALAKLEGGQS